MMMETENTDPVVRLLLEAFADEFRRIEQAIEASDGRLLNILVDLLTVEIDKNEINLV
ncbi:hypothetical protein AGMMS49965_17790 [Bacteroidia bacterium]|nr:hypothetical protein AGMMS49965_17790 [Bacteroidia bacterium]